MDDEGPLVVDDRMGQISYSALHNLAYDRITEALRTGRFKPGETLRTRTLAKALGVSSTPVREALSRLIAQNALDVDPRNRIAIVPEVTHGLLAEMYEIRMRLEGWAAEEAAAKISSKEISELRTIASKLDAREASGHAYDAAFLALSHKFFFTVYTAARLPLLLSLIDGLWLRSSAILGMMHKRRPEGFSISAQRAVLLAALEKGDGKRARQSLEKVLADTRDMVMLALSTDDGKSSSTSKRPARTIRKR